MLRCITLWSGTDQKSHFQEGFIDLELFLQAEAGIRNPLVTGVQTCALPIWRRAFTAHLAPLQKKNWFVYAKPPFARSEERRVVKECRSRWSPYHYKKTK